MSRYFLASAATEGFRGINNDGDPLVLKFKHDAVNSVHAPNGVGKSSIFEALHFALHGTVPRLENMQDAEQGGSYIVNKFHPAQQATVALVFKSDDGTPDVSITVTRTAAGNRVVTSPSGHADPGGLPRRSLRRFRAGRLPALCVPCRLLGTRARALFCHAGRHEPVFPAPAGARQSQEHP